MKSKILFGLTLILSLVLIVSVISAVGYAKPNLEKVKFIHYKNGNARVSPDKAVGKPSTVCYKLLNAKWNSQIDYSINPTNTQGLSESFVSNAIYSGAEQWDANTRTDLFGGYTINYSSFYGNQNYVNEISFGNQIDPAIIAVTTLWIDPSTKSIVEFDMEFDTDYTWGDATKTSSVMDVQNIATHELGHAVGLGDLYTSACSSETMYGYSGYGETIKRTLNKGDIDGLRKIYGR